MRGGAEMLLGGRPRDTVDGPADRPALPAARRHEAAAGMAVLCGRVAAIRLLEDALHRRAALGTQPEETEDGRSVARVVHDRERAAHVARVVLRRTRAVEGGTRARRLDAPAKTRDVARVGGGGRTGEAGARRPRGRGERDGDD